MPPLAKEFTFHREYDDWLLYAFLTTEANNVVAPVHPDAMPVILTDPDECKEWLEDGSESLRLHRPLDSALLKTVDPEALSNFDQV